MDLSHWIERQADFHGAKAAIVFQDRTITYGNFRDQIRAIARALKHRLGVGRGERVAYLGYNSPEFLALLFATARLGAMLTPLNWRLAAPEHDFILSDAGVSVLFVEQDFHAHAEALRGAHPDCRFVAVDFQAEDWQSLDTLATSDDDDRNPHVGYAAPHLIVYTSGTTGRPKGAVLTQNALFWNAINSIHLHDMTSEDVVMTVLPLFHVGGLNNQTLPAFHAGATVVLHRRFEPKATLVGIGEHQPTLMVLVPATIQAVINQPDWPTADISSLRSMTTGSSVVPHHLIEAFHTRGVPVLQIYGATETSPIAAYLRAEDAARKLGTTGKAALHTEVRIVTENGQVAGPGETGEIQVRGPNVMLQYWGDAAATAESLQDGWFLTGDIGLWDEDGFLIVSDRKKDIIHSGGENIYPAELELILHEIDGVAEAAVVPRSDPRWGEVPVAVIVPEPGHELEKAGIISVFEGRLARFKHPRDVVFRESLPRNAMGKVQKFELKEMI